MKCSALILVCFVVVGFAASSAEAEDFDVYVLAGQSNMDGRGAVKDLRSSKSEFVQSRTDIPFWYANSFGDVYSTGWIGLAPGYSIPPGFGKGPQTLPSGTFGVEVSFGPAMMKHSEGRRVAIIKVARGGTSLTRDWLVDTSDKGPLYPLLIDTVKQSLAAMAARGDEGHLRGLLWHQGESDRKLKSYAERFEVFVARIREDLESPDLPLVIGAVYDNGKRDIVRAQHVLAAEQIPHAIHVPSEGLTTYEGTHFDTDSIVEFGQRMADAMHELQNEGDFAP